ncbi:sigma-70 family RNA polymerase sigma factor [Gorillibacterium massiliense]|uniref:sigma-70 family RNA polymerase sigma factor n=1 Tax=Gorillibacterium massiliense TaxID=1280390 RepID=UPI0004B52DEA
MADSDDRKSILADLMTAYGNDVWNYAFSLTRKRDLADDITQDVFLKAYRGLFTLRKEGSVKMWLLAITRNTAADYRRSAFFRRVTLFESFDYTSSQPSAEETAMDRFSITDIWEKVLRLPPKYREVLILFGHHQMSMKEIASLLGVTEGTVKSRLFQARAKITKMKEGETHEPK